MLEFVLPPAAAMAVYLLVLLLVQRMFGPKWRARSRDIDRQVLLPCIASKAPSMREAVVAWLSHTSVDDAWRGVDDDELRASVELIREAWSETHA